MMTIEELAATPCSICGATPCTGRARIVFLGGGGFAAPGPSVELCKAHAGLRLEIDVATPVDVDTIRSVHREAAAHVKEHGAVIRYPNQTAGTSPFYRVMMETAALLRDVGAWAYP